MEKRRKWLWVILFCLFAVSFLAPDKVVRAEGDTQKVRALLITRGDYDSPGDGGSDLTPGPQNDGENFRRTLEKTYEGNLTCTVKDKEGVTNKEGVKSAIQTVFQDSEEGDVNYFYYSGHGRSSGLALHNSTTMTASELAAAFSQIKGKNILVIDCCYSGNLIPKGGKSLEASQENFADAFIEEFEAAVSNMQKKSRSALASQSFQIITASSREELSWQGGLGLNGESMGLFTSSLSFGCGVNPMKVGDASDYTLGIAAADFNQDQSISFQEIYQYIAQVNQCSHVRMYPETDYSEFLPIQASEIPAVSFEKAEVVYDEAGDATLQLSYRAADSFSLKCAYYRGDDWGLSTLLVDGCAANSFEKYNYSNASSGTMVWMGEKSEKITLDGSGLYTISLPMNKESVVTGDYSIMLQVEGQSARYILPFSIVKSSKEVSSLLEKFQIVMKDTEFKPENGNELEIKADFGKVYTEDTPKLNIDCEILNSEEAVVQTLGKQELMQVIQSGSGSSYYCYRKFFWDGQQEDGTLAEPGNYKVRVRAVLGNKECVLEEPFTIIGEPELSACSLSQSSMDLPVSAQRPGLTAEYTTNYSGKITAKVYDASGNVVKILQENVKEKAGTHQIQWDGTTENKNMPLPTGEENPFYYIKIEFEVENSDIVMDSGKLQFTLSREELGVVLEKQNTAKLEIPAGEAESVNDYQVNYPCKITAQVYDATGKIVETLLNHKSVDEGTFTITWDGKADGVYVPSGDYSIQILAQAETFQDVTEDTVKLHVERESFQMGVAEAQPAELTLPDEKASAVISYSLNYPAKVTAEVVDAADKKILTIQGGKEMEAGTWQLSWNGKGEDGTPVAAGIYMVRLKAEAQITKETEEKNIRITIKKAEENTEPNTPETDEKSETEKQTESEEQTEPITPVKPPAIVKPSAVSAKIKNRTVRKVTIGTKEKMILSPAIRPANAANKTVRYKSSNSKIVSVSSKGKVTGKRKGKAKITITTWNGKKAVVAVTVKKAPSKIVLAAKSKTLKRKKSFVIKTKLPSGSASYKITYSSSNRKVASVDARGRVKALKKGKATITVRTYNGKKARIKVIVK